MLLKTSLRLIGSYMNGASLLQQLKSSRESRSRKSRDALDVVPVLRALWASRERRQWKKPSGNEYGTGYVELIPGKSNRHIESSLRC